MGAILQSGDNNLRARSASVRYTAGLVYRAGWALAHLPSDTVLEANHLLDLLPVQQLPHALGTGDALYARQWIARPFIHIAMHF